MVLHKWLTDSTKSRGSAKALVYRDTYLSWRGLFHRVDRRVQEFKAMGIGKGHWVGLMLGNVPDFAILALALSKVGAVVVPIDPTTGARDLGLMMDYAPLRALITRPRGDVEMQQTQAVQPERAKGGESVESRRRLQGTLLTCSIYKAPAKAPGEAATVLFTNDSSGDPKGVLRSDANLEQNAKQLMETLEITGDDRILTTVPLYHAYGFDLGLCLALKYGATLFLEDDVAPSRIIKILREQEINVLPGTPQLYAGLAKLPTAKPLKIKNARYLSGGSALPEATAESFYERLGIRILPFFHITEAGPIACDKKGGVGGSVGKLVEGVEARIGNGKTPSEPGPLWVKSKAVSQKYVGRQVKSKGADVPIGGFDDKGWLHTGDVGYFDKTGRLFLTGREDKVVKIDGKRVALGEVETCLLEHNKIDHARVHVVTDPLTGPVVVASVVVHGRIKAEEIIDFCAKNLASYKVPRRIEFVDALPPAA